MGSSGDMANSEEGISKQELKTHLDYKSAAVLSIQKRQRENMKWQLIGKVIALVFFVSFFVGLILIDLWKYS